MESLLAGQLFACSLLTPHRPRLSRYHQTKNSKNWVESSWVKWVSSVTHPELYKSKRMDLNFWWFLWCISYSFKTKIVLFLRCYNPVWFSLFLKHCADIKYFKLFLQRSFCNLLKEAELWRQGLFVFFLFFWVQRNFPSPFKVAWSLISHIYQSITSSFLMSTWFLFPTTDLMFDNCIYVGLNIYFVTQIYADVWKSWTCNRLKNKS